MIYNHLTYLRFLVDFLAPIFGFRPVATFFTTRLIAGGNVDIGFFTEDFFATFR